MVEYHDVIIVGSGGTGSRAAIEVHDRGFDGVYIAADGEECPFRRDCTKITSARAEEAIKLLRENGIEPQRIKMAAICSVCTDASVKSINEFYEVLKKLGPVKRGDMDE